MLLAHLADRSAEWWELAQAGHPSTTADALEVLRQARHEGQRTSLRQRSIPASLAQAAQQLEDHRARVATERAQRAQAEQRRARAHDAEQQRQRTSVAQAQAHERALHRRAASDLRHLAQQLEEARSPIPGVPEPGLAEARQLEGTQRRAVLRFMARRATAARALALAEQLEAGSGDLRAARALLTAELEGTAQATADHYAPQRPPSRVDGLGDSISDARCASVYQKVGEVDPAQVTQAQTQDMCWSAQNSPGSPPALPELPSDPGAGRPLPGAKKEGETWGPW